jgi:hypothetical protein
MLKFFKKYELPLKIVALTAWMSGAVWKIFLEDESGNRNFDLFAGIVIALLGVFYLFEIIELIKRTKRTSGC